MDGWNCDRLKLLQAARRNVVADCKDAIVSLLRGKYENVVWRGKI